MVNGQVKIKDIQTSTEAKPAKAYFRLISTFQGANKSYMIEHVTKGAQNL